MSYQAHKARAAKRQAEQSATGRDIGEIPPVSDPARRAACSRDFERFCLTYFASTFNLPFSEDHKRAIKKIEASVLRGGLFALAMPRGSGKSTLAETAAIWAMLYGYREFVALVGASEDHAEEMLDSIKIELEDNPLLLEDFPEVCFPIRALEGIANRCKGQTCQGKRTAITWTSKTLVLPTVEGSKSSGAIVKVAGITGRIRGMKHKKPGSATPIRPSLVIVDDPQTDESARSISQCQYREAVLSGAVLGLAGPGVKISGIMPCTVVRRGDMADAILDNKKHPSWKGERFKFVYSFPENESLWERYRQIREDSLREGREGEEATEFYRQNREEMDKGARVAWPERFNSDELSAIQHAMNIKFRDEGAFAAEYQNEPNDSRDTDEETLGADLIAAKINGQKRGESPPEAQFLTAGIDVHGELLYWLVVAWRSDFTGYVLDYGTEPEQNRPYFTLREAEPGLSEAHKSGSLEGRIAAGLKALTERIFSRRWLSADGDPLSLDRATIDANWGESTDTVYSFARTSQYSAQLLPLHGKYIGAASKPIDLQGAEGDRRGPGWRIPGKKARGLKYLLVDVNHWKSFLAARWSVPLGAPGALSLFGDTRHAHRLIADHFTAEYRVKTEGRGRVVDEWKLKPGKPDNHWLDCLVGAACAASTLGAAIVGGTAPSQKPKRKTYAELRAERGR